MRIRCSKQIFFAVPVPVLKKIENRTINEDGISKAGPDPAQKNFFKIKIAPDPSRPQTKTTYRYRYGQEMLYFEKIIYNHSHQVPGARDPDAARRQVLREAAGGQRGGHAPLQCRHRRAGGEAKPDSGPPRLRRASPGPISSRSRYSTSLLVLPSQ
jgi:hypothetical protein